MDLLADFFDQDAHLAVGGLEVDGELVMTEAFAGGRADGGHHHPLARVFKAFRFPLLLHQLHHVIDLRRVGDQHYIELAV
jgi:hypothetical protein